MPFPNAPGMVKNNLFVAGYMIWDAFYTVANVPYGASTAITVMFQAYFNAAQISGIVSMLGYIGVFLYMPFINQIMRRFGKKAFLVASQTMEVATNMRYLVAFMYLLSALIQLVSYGLIYNIDRKTLENMERDLAQRREEAY